MNRQNLKKWLNYSIPAIALIGTLFIVAVKEDFMDKKDETSSYNDANQVESLSEYEDTKKGDSESEQIAGTSNQTGASQVAQATDSTSSVSLEGTSSVTVTEPNQSITEDSTPTTGTASSQEVETPRTIVTTSPEQIAKSSTHIKYGVYLVVYQVNMYTEYSDGSKELVGTYDKQELDTSGYYATDQELKADAAGVSAANIAYAEKILELVNQIRAEAGVGALTLDTNLSKAATIRAIELDYSNTFAHSRPDGRHWNTVFSLCGVGSYIKAGENIAAGQKTPEQVVEAWKNSKGHYENMIDTSFTKMGIGYSSSGVGTYKVYWAQLFTN